MAKTLDHRLKPFLHLLLARRGNSSERAAVEGIERGDDFEPAFVVPKLPRQLVKPFVGFSAAVAEKDFARRERCDDRLCEPSLRFVVIKVGDVNQLLRLLDERLGNLRVRVPEAAHRDTSAK